VALFLAAAPTIRAEFKYKGEGTTGGLVPDFPQKFATQAVGGVCGAAAIANSFWYYDQHDYAGLVKQSNEAKPNDSWHKDVQQLQRELAQNIYGKNPVNGNPAKDGQVGMSEAIIRYISHKDRKLYDGQVPDNKGLTLRYFSGDEATYNTWQTELARSEDIIGNFTWHNLDGSLTLFPEDPNDPNSKKDDARHAMTGAGWDTEKNQLVVSNPWGDHPGKGQAPHNAGFFDKFDIAIDPNGRVRIPKKDGVSLFEGRLSSAAYILLDGFWDVSPGKAAKVVPHTGPGSTPKMVNYDYQVENMTFDPIYQVALQVQVPFSLSTVTAPPGWNFTLWDPALTLDVTPEPPLLPEPEDPLPPEFFEEYDPDYQGILWYTETDPVPAGSVLGGFTFEASNIFPFEQYAATAGLGNGLSSYLNSSSVGLVTEFALTSGPVMIPEPSMNVLIMKGMMTLVFTNERRSARPPTRQL
jgi:hypothetical protein